MKKYMITFKDGKQVTVTHRRLVLFDEKTEAITLMQRDTIYLNASEVRSVVTPGEDEA